MNKEQKKDRIVKYIGMFWTAYGLFTMIYFCDFTNGLLMMILGELIDQPKIK